MIVEVSTHGSAIRRRRDRFIIENKIQDGKKEQVEIPAEKVDAIMVTANAMVSTQAIKLCIEKQIQLVFASYGGRPFARMWASTPGKATEIRRRQYLNSDTKIALEISREIVSKKLGGQKRVLMDLRNNRKKSDNDILLHGLADAIQTMNQTIQKVKQLEPNISGFKQTLLGLEGLCAARYFSIISSCLPKKWQFEKRSQNPGLDSFNASLNYMYGMGYATVEKTIILSGLDPNAGFYHADSYGKPTLAFDIIEMCRPVIDKTLISIFNKKMVRDDWFEDELEGASDAGVKITKNGRNSLLSAYWEEDVKQVEKISWKYCRNIIEKLMGGNSGDEMT